MAAPAAVQQQAVAPFEWPAVPVVPGVHRMQPQLGPVGPAGWERSAAGALNCRWSCEACGKAAGNSSRLFELLRTPCGEQGEWRQMKHEATIVHDKMQCSRCGVERQKCVQLSLQSCPVRAFFQAGEEVPAATAVYAAWHRCVKAMHACTKASGRLQADAAAAVPLAVAPAVGAVAGARARAACCGSPPVPVARLCAVRRGGVLHVVFRQGPSLQSRRLETRLLRWGGPSRELP
jgi:ferredoxin